MTSVDDAAILTVCAPSSDNPSFDVWQLTVTVTEDDMDDWAKFVATRGLTHDSPLVDRSSKTACCATELIRGCETKDAARAP
jgi:hypothetical protein